MIENDSRNISQVVGLAQGVRTSII